MKGIIPTESSVNLDSTPEARIGRLIPWGSKAAILRKGRGTKVLKTKKTATTPTVTAILVISSLFLKTDFIAEPKLIRVWLIFGRGLTAAFGGALSPPAASEIS